ncbi:conserved protein of unknown function [Nitrospira japonica]|uniref:Lipoprotein n=2 Tax=Nitrospira japonica TaxID=1325564 RepID=A0A1W1I019_9BACT|nr:conserved protein of unknown function [Nitrospira japonica]
MLYFREEKAPNGRMTEGQVSRKGARGVSFALVSAMLLASCASAVPPSRLGDYLSPESQADAGVFGRLEPRPVPAGLLLVSDTAHPGASPNLPDEALRQLGESLKQEVSRAIPVRIKEMVPPESIQPQANGDWAQFAELAKKHELEYLVLVVLSSTEQEYPVTLFLGWTTYAQPGFRRDNWSLLEVALLDVRNNRVLIQAEGRGWATLDSPTAPGINQWYPVIYLRPQDPERRIWPPTYEGAPNTLRVVSFDQAAKRMTLNLQKAWIESLQAAGAEVHESS